MLTYFANKLDAEHLYELWDLVIHDGDPFLLFYLGLAFLLINKETLIDKDASVLPQALATLKMASPAEVRRCYNRAKSLKANTPFSFEAFFEKEKLVH